MVLTKALVVVLTKALVVALTEAFIVALTEPLAVPLTKALVVAITKALVVGQFSVAFQNGQEWKNISDQLTGFLLKYEKFEEKIGESVPSQTA